MSTDALPHSLDETVLRPPSAWQFINFGELWRYRELVVILIWRDVKVRYKQTVLGAAWAVLQPLLMMVVFTLVFSRVAGASPAGEGVLPYPLFVLSGLLPWLFFSQAVTTGSQSVVGSERLITKVYFPRLALPFASVFAALVDFAVAFGLLLVAMLAWGYVPGISFLLVPVVFTVVVVLTLGVATGLAGLHVAFRDFRHVTPFLIQLWMFATPAIYLPGVGASSESWVRTLLMLNPMNGLIDAFRAACLGSPVDLTGPALATGLAVVAFFAGCFVFRKVESWFADII
jgi:lipopolysaccharide transport system permease protein